MLQYRRRDAATSQPMSSGNTVPALVGLCNWSYDRSRRVDSRILRDILTSFSPDHIHLYLRIFNEASPQMLTSFMEYAGLETSRVETIYRVLEERGYDLRDLNDLL